MSIIFLLVFSPYFPQHLLTVIPFCPMCACQFPSKPHLCCFKSCFPKVQVSHSYISTPQTRPVSRMFFLVLTLICLFDNKFLLVWKACFAIAVLVLLQSLFRQISKITTLINNNNKLFPFSSHRVYGLLVNEPSFSHLVTKRSLTFPSGAVLLRLHYPTCLPPLIITSTFQQHWTCEVVLGFSKISTQIQQHLKALVLYRIFFNFGFVEFMDVEK